MTKDIVSGLADIMRMNILRKEELKQFLPILIFFVFLTIMVNAGLLFILEIVIPSYEILIGTRASYLISFLLISPFVIVYAFIIYHHLNRKVIDEIRLRQNIITALRKSEERYKTLFNNASDAIFLHDFDGNIIEANKIACEKLGYTKTEITLMKMKDIDRSDIQPPYDSTSPGKTFLQSTFDEINFFDKNGKEILFGVQSTLIEYKNSSVIMVVARDITETKKHEQQLQVYQQQLKNLAAKLSLVQDEERRKIAVDLHDYIGQNLAISKLKLQIILHENKNQPQVNEVLNLLNQTIPFIRNLTSSLSPSILFDLDFKSAMEWLCELFQRDYKLEVFLNYDESQQTKLPDNIKVILFQAVRELLINIVKHSKVNYAFLNIKRSNGSFNITVEDNGVGFDTDKLFNTFDSDSGFGLFSTKERIEYIGGEFLAESEKGKSTKIMLKIPCNKLT